MKNEKISAKTNLMDWLVYFIFTMVFMAPFFWGLWTKHICISLLISFFAGLMNRIIRELDRINEKLK